MISTWRWLTNSSTDIFDKLTVVVFRMMLLGFFLAVLLFELGMF